MTTKQLYSDVLAMGFDRRCTDAESNFDKILETSVNRAQETLASLFPLYSERVLNLSDAPSALSVRECRLFAGEEREWSVLNAKSYTFCARGTGVLSVIAGGVTLERHKIEAPLCEMRFSKNLTDGGALLFHAEAQEGTLLLQDLTVFDEGFDGTWRQGKERCIPLSAMLDGALTLAAPPKDAEGRTLKEGRDYRVCGGTLYLSERVKGQLYLTIERAPRRFDLSCEAPDVREEALNLLPLLVAAYAWLDDDREKALFYLAMYREGLSRTLANGRLAGVGYTYGDTNGW